MAAGRWQRSFHPHLSVPAYPDAGLGLICTTQGVNLFIAFAPIMVMMAFANGDSITVHPSSCWAALLGLSTGPPLNINTPPSWLRKSPGCRCIPAWDTALFRFKFYVITNIYPIRYALKIQKHPELSPMYEIDKTSGVPQCCGPDSSGKLTPARSWHYAGLRIPYPHRSTAASSSTGIWLRPQLSSSHWLSSKAYWVAWASCDFQRVP